LLAQVLGGNKTGKMESKTNLKLKQEVIMESLYPAFVSVRNTELVAYWSRYNIQTVLNFGLLAAALSANPGSFIVQHKILIGVGGIILSFVWVGFILMGKKLLTERWDSYIRECEKGFSNNEIKLFTRVEDEEKKICKLKRHWRNLNILAYIPPTLCIFAWVFLALFQVTPSSR